MSALTLATSEIRDFVAAVRDALTDLPQGEADELVDGLEADLTARWLDPDAADLPPLGNPAGYADELRAAAGLPARSPKPIRRSLIGVAIANARENLVELRRKPVIERSIPTLIALRPVWWVIRGWLAYLWISLGLGVPNALPTTVFALVAFIGAIAVSVQFGRGRWMPWAWLPRAMVAVNIAAVISLPFVLGWAYSVQAGPSVYYTDVEPASYPAEGLSSNGALVSNIFAYGPDGELLDGVQLFDQDGNPLNLVGDSKMEYLDGDGRMLVPSNVVIGRPGWNVVPLMYITEGSFDKNGVPRDDAVRRPDTAPFPSVQPLADVDPVPAEPKE